MVVFIQSKFTTLYAIVAAAGQQLQNNSRHKSRRKFIRHEDIGQHSALQLSSTSDYSEAVLDDTYHDGPVAFWRLGEHSVTDSVLNDATSSVVAVGLGTAVDGSYVYDTSGQSPITRSPGLIVNDGNYAVDFAGVSNQEVHIPSHTSIDNRQVDFRTIELWFKASSIDNNPQFLYTEGDGSAGFNIFVQLVGGYPSASSALTMCAWSSTWGWKSVQTPYTMQVADDQLYFAALVFDIPSSTSGTLKGYLNGQWFGESANVDTMAAHGSGQIVLGGLLGETKSSASSLVQSGGNFNGTLDEVAIFNIALNTTSLNLHYQTGLGNAP